MVQKQSGSGELPVKIKVKKTDGNETSVKEILTGDREFDF